MVYGCFVFINIFKVLFGFKASEITKGDNYQNPILGLYIMQYFNNTAKAQGGVIQKNLGRMLRDIHETGVTILPIITKSDEKSVENLNIESHLTNASLLRHL